MNKFILGQDETVHIFDLFAGTHHSFDLKGGKYKSSGFLTRRYDEHLWIFWENLLCVYDENCKVVASIKDIAEVHIAKYAEDFTLRNLNGFTKIWNWSTGEVVDSNMLHRLIDFRIKCSCNSVGFLRIDKSHVRGELDDSKKIYRLIYYECLGIPKIRRARTRYSAILKAEKKYVEAMFDFEILSDFFISKDRIILIGSEKSVIVDLELKEEFSIEHSALYNQSHPFETFEKLKFKSPTSKDFQKLADLITITTSTSTSYIPKDVSNMFVHYLE